MKIDLLKSGGEGGCSAKLPAKELERALADLPEVVSDKLLVSIDTHDDAGVYQISKDIALIQTTDFFPPVCSDPYEFGQIAAANALSDVFAMGGKVLTAMNLLMFPAFEPMEALKEILRGGQDKVEESGGLLVGGHTITDEGVKYGLAITGEVHPDKVITNAGAEEGDVLILTKPIGSGIIMAGKKIDEVNENDYQATLDGMKLLNKVGAEIMQKYNVRSATDITGFGLIGHASKMAKASNLTFEIYSQKVPYLSGTMNLAKMGCIPGACFRNQEYADDTCSVNKDVSYEEKMILFDAQTSGGLLMAVKPKYADEILNELRQSAYPDSAIVGQAVNKKSSWVFVLDSINETTSNNG